jgi:hypothetical protein
MGRGPRPQAGRFRELFRQRQAKTIEKTKQFTLRYYITSLVGRAGGQGSWYGSRRLPPPDAAMKRFVLAGLFLALGFIILGVATSYVMSGPDKPKQPPHPTAANADESKGHGGQAAAPPQQVNTQPTQSQNRPGQFGMTGTSGGLGGTQDSMSGTTGTMTGPMRNLTQVPSTIIPLTTTIQSPSVRPNADANNAPQVPVLPQTDESSSHRGH